MRQSKGLLPAAGNSNNLPPYSGQIAFGLGLKNTPLVVYDFDSASGFGKKYADPLTPFPTDSIGRGLTWAPDGKSIIIGITKYPRLVAYTFSPATGVGEKLPDPPPPQGGFSAFPDGVPTEIVMSTDNQTVFMSTGGRYGQWAYPYDNSTGLQARYFSPDVELGVNTNGVAVNSDNTRLAFTQQAAPQLYVQGFETGVGWLDDVFQPSITFQYSNYGVEFSKDDKSVIVCGSTLSGNPGLWAFEWDNSTGFGAQLASPAVIPNGSQYECTFSAAGDVVFSGGGGEFPFSAYQYSSSTGFGAKIADPSTPVTTPNTIINGIAVSPGGDLVALGVYGEPFIIVYEWTGSGFGKRYADPSVLGSSDPTVRSYKVAFNPAYY